MRAEANANRETLRSLIEQKLDHSISRQSETSKTLRDELGGNFQRLGSRVSKSLTEIEPAAKRAIGKRHSRSHRPQREIGKAQEGCA